MKFDGTLTIELTDFTTEQMEKLQAHWTDIRRVSGDAYKSAAGAKSACIRQLNRMGVMY